MLPRFDQQLLAGDLLAPVVPIGVGLRRPLCYQPVARRFLVRGGGGNEHVLAGTGEDVDVLLHLGREVTDPLNHGVPIAASQGGPYLGLVVSVGDDGPFGGHRDLEAGPAAVEKPKFVPSGDSRGRADAAYETGTSHEQGPHA